MTNESGDTGRHPAKYIHSADGSCPQSCISMISSRILHILWTPLLSASFIDISNATMHSPRSFFAKRLSYIAEGSQREIAEEEGPPYTRLPGTPAIDVYRSCTLICKIIMAAYDLGSCVVLLFNRGEARTTSTVQNIRILHRNLASYSCIKFHAVNLCM